LIFVRLPYLFDISAISKNAMKNIFTRAKKNKSILWQNEFQQYSLPFLKKKNNKKKRLSSLKVFLSL